MARYRQERLTASLKRSLYGPTLKPIETDYTMKEINSLLTSILGKPGKSAGHAGDSRGMGTNNGQSYYPEQSAMYTSAQIDDMARGMNASSGKGAGWLGLIGTVLNIGYNQYAAKQAYDRQNEFYNNHLSMPAKVQEYQDAGLNPMALGGAGVGATSAPQVSQAEGGSALVDVLGQLLNYKLKSRELDIQSRVADADIDLKESSTSVNTVTVDKIVAETDRIFSETSKIDAESYILQLQGKYADDRFKAELDNLLKDLDLKDVQITKTDAEAANAWIIANYQELQQLAEIKLKKGQSFASYAAGALDNYTKEYAESHDGALPYSGIAAAIIAGLGTLLGAEDKGVLDTIREDVVEPVVNTVSDQALIERGKESVKYVSRDSTGTSEFRRDIAELKRLLQRGKSRRPYTTYGP